MKKENLLLVFARPPVAGKAKTRLIPELGAEGAAELYKKLLSRTLDNVCVNAHWDVTLCMADEALPEYAQSLLETHGCQLAHQSQGDLGERMYQAIENGVHHYKKVALIGTDCPLIDANLVETVFYLLDSSDLVITPAEDGGYVLIAAREIQRAVFQNVAWGSADVLAQTQKNITDNDIKVSFTGVLWDVDTPQDLARYYAFASELPVV